MAGYFLFWLFNMIWDGWWWLSNSSSHHIPSKWFDFRFQALGWTRDMVRWKSSCGSRHWNQFPTWSVTRFGTQTFSGWLLKCFGYLLFFSEMGWWSAMRLALNHGISTTKQPLIIPKPTVWGLVCIIHDPLTGRFSAKLRLCATWSSSGLIGCGPLALVPPEINHELVNLCLSFSILGWCPWTVTFIFFSQKSPVHNKRHVSFSTLFQRNTHWGEEKGHHGHRGH